MQTIAASNGVKKWGPVTDRVRGQIREPLRP